MGWILDTSYVFSVPSSHGFLDGGTLFLGGVKTLWNNLVPFKINILIWRITIFNIPTRERLSHRGIMVDFILCAVYSLFVESVDHNFVGCIELLEVWL